MVWMDEVDGCFVVTRVSKAGQAIGFICYTFQEATDLCASLRASLEQWSIANA